jgi:DNA topoisomerase-1
VPQRRSTRQNLPRVWLHLVEQQSKDRRRISPRAAERQTTNPAKAAEAAEAAALRYVASNEAAGIHRTGRAHVRYVDSRGRRISNPRVLARIRGLAIPPAWTDVWICSDPQGHLQATGRDARGRKQYRYHKRWREVRDIAKYARLPAFARALPRIRARAAADLACPGLSRAKVLAAVVQLLEKTLIRVGNEEYARQNHSFGLTTLRDRHAHINGRAVRFDFRGKSDIEHAIDVQDARLARVVKACRDLPGQKLFQYVDASGRRQAVVSADVNAYLRDAAGQAFSAKDFRTWAGTLLATRALAELGAFRTVAEAKRNVVRAIESVASCLGNTKAVCRKSYVHPAIVDAYLEGALSSSATLQSTDVESVAVAIIERRFARARTG